MEHNAQIQEKTKISLGFFYSFGEVGSQLSWYMINTYLTIFYTDIVGLSAAAISFIMLVARIWDAFNDPAVGMIADRTRTRWGKFRPYLMFMPPFLAVFNILTFTVFPVSGILKIILCLVFYMLAGTAYAALNVTYGGLVNLIARDSQVRMNYTAARAIGSAVIGIILSAVAMPLILYFSHGSKANSNGYFWTTIICSILVIPCFWLAAWKCRETVHVEMPSATREKKPVFKSIKLMFQNRMLMITVLCVFMGAVAIIGRMSLLTYYVIYVVGSFTMIAPIYTTMTIFQLVGCIILPWGTRVLGKRNLLVIMSVIQIVSFLLMFLVPANNMVFLLAVSAVIGFTNSCSNICTGMLSDCIEYGDWKYGIREEGLTYSFMSFSVKLASAIAGSVGVILLAATGYVAGAQQTPAAMHGINMVVNLLPAACIVLSTIPLFFYKLDKKMMDQIRVELDQRNQK